MNYEKEWKEKFKVGDLIKIKTKGIIAKCEIEFFGKRSLLVFDANDSTSDSIYYDENPDNFMLITPPEEEKFYWEYVDEDKSLRRNINPMTISELKGILIKLSVRCIAYRKICSAKLLPEDGWVKV